MKKMKALVVALGATALFSSVVLASADCSYHKTQASVDKTDASKDVASAPVSDKTTTGQGRTAQVDQAAKPAPEIKK